MATYEKSFKEEAVRLSDDIGVKQAAVQLGIPYWTLAGGAESTWQPGIRGQWAQTATDR